MSDIEAREESIAARTERIKKLEKQMAEYAARINATLRTIWRLSR